VMALLGSFNPNTSAVAGLNVGLFRTFLVLGGIGTILTAGYFLWMLQRVNMGLAPERWKEHGFRDILAVEWVSWTPLLVAILLLGVIPSIVFNSTEQGVNAIVRIFGG
jgi:NADH-quinone oxidoreductase subunit M